MAQLTTRPSIPVPSSGTALDRPGMSLGAPGWKEPAIHRLKPANAQHANRTAVTELTSVRSFDEADLSTPSQHAAGSRTERIMMTAESNTGMGAMVCPAANLTYILYVCYLFCQLA